MSMNETAELAQAVAFVYPDAGPRQISVDGRVVGTLPADRSLRVFVRKALTGDQETRGGKDLHVTPPAEASGRVRMRLELSPRLRYCVDVFLMQGEAINIVSYPVEATC